MTKYLVTACGTVFLSVIVSFIIPQGKLERTITAMLRMVCIAILISPIVTLFDFNSSGYGYQDYVDYSFICTVYSNEQSNALEEILYEEYGVKTKCFVTIVYADDEFKAESVEVCLLTPKEEVTEKIYEYLQADGYININVYEQKDGNS